MANIGKYNGEALATKEKIMAGMNTYMPNKVYKNIQYNIYWFINNHGYMHVLKPLGVRMNGEILHYAIEDYLLTKDNMLQSKGRSGDFQTVEATIEELERRAA